MAEADLEDLVLGYLLCKASLLQRRLQIQELEQDCVQVPRLGTERAAPSGLHKLCSTSLRYRCVRAEMRMRIVSAWFQSAPRIASTGWHLQQGCARKRKRNPVAALRCRTMCRRWSSRHLERRARPRPLGEPRRSGPVGSLAHSICILGRRNCGGRKEAHSDSRREAGRGRSRSRHARSWKATKLGGGETAGQRLSGAACTARPAQMPTRTHAEGVSKFPAILLWQLLLRVRNAYCTTECNTRSASQLSQLAQPL